MTEKNVTTKICEELFAAHPELLKDSGGVFAIVSKMVESKPEIEMDRAFLSDLKSKLAKEAAILKSPVAASFKLPDWFRFLSVPAVLAAVAIGASVFMIEDAEPTKLPSSDGNALVAVTGNAPTDPTSGFVADSGTAESGATASGTVSSGTLELVTGSAAISPIRTSSGVMDAISESSGRRIAYVGKSKFGDFYNPAGAPPLSERSKSAPSMPPSVSTSALKMAPPANLSSDQAPQPLSDAAKMSDSVTSMGTPDSIGSSKMISPSPEYQITAYAYAFSGELPKLPSELPVYVRKKPRGGSFAFSGSFANLKSGFELSGFAGSKLKSFVVSEDTEYGLDASVDLENGTLNFYRNASKWPSNACNSDECFRKSRVRSEQVPDSGTALAIAKAFAIGRKIDLSGYSEGIVDQSWKDIFASSLNESDAFVPESVSVTFPLRFEGKTAYEEYGVPKGITFSVDVRSMKVSEITGLETGNYEASDYEIENEKSKILAVLKQGGRFGNPTENASGTNVKTILMKSAELAYVSIPGNYDGTDSNYYVPALVFKTDEKSDGGEYFQKTVVVPLMKSASARAPSPEIRTAPPSPMPKAYR